MGAPLGIRRLWRLWGGAPIGITTTPLGAVAAPGAVGWQPYGGGRPHTPVGAELRPPPHPPQVAMQSLWNIKVVVLVKPEHENRISHVSTSSVKTGIANTLGRARGGRPRPRLTSPSPACPQPHVPNLMSPACPLLPSLSPPHVPVASPSRLHARVCPRSLLSPL